MPAAPDSRPTDDAVTDRIRIRNARQHNLKGLDLDLPRRALVVVTGPPTVLIVEGAPGEAQFLADALRRQAGDHHITERHLADAIEQLMAGRDGGVRARIP